MFENSKVSIVIPAYNEEGSIGDLIDEIKNIFKKSSQLVEIIVVDDGSKDKTTKVVKRKEGVILIKLKKNYGQSYALDAGLRKASGEYVVTMDADRQNDPADIPKMLEMLNEKKLDLVCGWRKDRKDPKSIKIAAKIAAKLRKIFLKDDTIDSGCTLKVFKKGVIEKLNLFKGMHRFIPALLKAQGLKTADMKVNHRPRTTGKTKYNWLKYFPGMLGMLTVWKVRLDYQNSKYTPLFFWVLLSFVFIFSNLFFSVSLLVNSLLLFSLSIFLFLLIVVKFEAKKYYDYQPEYKIEEIKYL